MAIIKNKNTIGKKEDIIIPDNLKSDVQKILNEQSKTYMAIGILLDDYEAGKYLLLKELDKTNNDYIEFLKILENKYGKGELNTESWTYEIKNKGDN